MKYHLPLILFDPECPLCVRFKQGLEYLDKNLHFVSAREEEVYQQFPMLDKDACVSSVHMITIDNQILKGSEVVDHLLQTLPGVSKLSWLLENDQGRKIKDYFLQKVDELREITRQKNEGDCRECPKDD